MPTKSAHLIAFLSVFLISAGLHRFVYANLKRIILRDYRRLGPRLVRIAMWLFIVMDSPFIFLFFRNRIPMALMTTTKFLIYPFSVWQAVMILWGVILVPFALWRRSNAFGFRWIASKLRVWKSRKQEDGSSGDIESLEGMGEENLGIVTE